MSSSVMCAMLKKADLENNGYQKKVMSNVVEEPGSNMSNFQVNHVHVKISLLSVVMRFKVLLILDLVNCVLFSCILCFNCVLMIIMHFF